ncbi:MAG TPA: DUF4097 family beta strand repeat-containing protein, partial [Acidobacteriota bacterium]|nr:DUF4097 family beta strand repeat-containing protein [Acidobacteriota bacterium]
DKKMMMRLIPIVLLIASVCAAEDFTVETIDKTLQASGRTKITSKNMDGHTIFKAGPDGEIRIHAVKEVRYVKNKEDAEKEAARVPIRIQQVGPNVEIMAEYPTNWGIHIGRKPQVLVYFEITAPAGSDIDARLSDGKMDVEGFDGKLFLKVSDGDLNARNLKGYVRMSAADGDIEAVQCSGTVEVSVADGSINADSFSGDIRLRSADGRITLNNSNGIVEAKSSDGRVTLQGSFQSVNARTSDGKLEVHANAGSTVVNPWNLKTSDGSLMLQLPDSIQADFDIRTGDGSIVTDLPISIVGSVSRNHLSGKINGGGSLVMLQTSDGDITISRTAQ